MASYTTAMPPSPVLRTIRKRSQIRSLGRNRKNRAGVEVRSGSARVLWSSLDSGCINDCPRASGVHHSRDTLRAAGMDQYNGATLRLLALELNSALATSE